MTNFKTNEILSLLNKHGWYKHRQKGSHAIYKKAGSGSISIPINEKEVKYYIVKKVQKLLGLTKKKLEEEIKKI